MFENLSRAGKDHGISYLWAQEGEWINSEDKVLRMKNMEKDYLEKCIKMIDRQKESIPVTFIEFLKTQGKKYLNEAVENDELSSKDWECIYELIFEDTKKAIRRKINELSIESNKRA